jgi:hypothetical protein
MPAVLSGQSPVAVPIVGSPAAQQPTGPQPAAPASPASPQPSQQPSASQMAPMPQPAASAGPVVQGERKLELSVQGGTVSMEAQNVTVREILTEWQRKTGCQFVNGDKLTGSSVSIQLAPGTTEQDALAALLHSAAGYIMGPPHPDRVPAGTTCVEAFILPVSHPTGTSTSYNSAPSPIAAPLVMGSPDDELPPVPMPGPVPIPARGGNPVGPNSNQPQPGPSTPTTQQPTGGFGPGPAAAPGAGRLGGTPAPSPAPNGTGRGGGGGF